ncbi:hypothetical protein PK98_09595 [Croceibacterium mercuriale]|uniref:Uncharacterized protein n=1 Tax=Croceibacterium mercuriale TaxID=1572751 RepID=A0A0B2C351_9SPHN|nr:hypothetical protein [Croceibacterium mercuriale]KHL26600.1 hypothetical protein PK98_09595 [Croceibacterium mercuriale]
MRNLIGRRSSLEFSLKQQLSDVRDQAHLRRGRRDALEALQLAHRTRCAAGLLVDVQLHDLVTSALPGVTNGGADDQAAAALQRP